MEANDPIEVLEAETRDLEQMLDGLDAGSWDRPSVCEGWTVSDVVLHLAQTEEAVAATARGETFVFPVVEGATTIDEIVAGWVNAERGEPGPRVLERWKAARRASSAALRAADPGALLQWAAAPLKPRTLATTRVSEHWIHAHDVADALGIDYPDTERLWHIARLAHRTIPYAFARAGRPEPPAVRVELDAPDGGKWSFGPEDAPCRVSGAAGEFCRVAGRRLPPADAATLRATGERADEVMELVRTYA